MKNTGSTFAEKDIEAAIQVAKKYYADWAVQPIKKEILSKEEIAAQEQFQDWLSQRVELTYNKEKMYEYIMGSGLKEQISAYAGAGNVIVLRTKIPAAPDDYGFRTVTLYREGSKTEWFVKTEGF